MAALTTESCNTLALAIKDVLDFMNVHEAASQNASPRAPAPERQMGAPREAAGFSKRAVPAMTPAEIAQPPPADFLSPRTDPPAKRAKLVGYDNFVRHNPHSDRFEVKRFHHLEITCGDAKSTAAVLCTALGFRPLAHSNMMTGNTTYASYVVGSGSTTFVCTAPYGDPSSTTSVKPPPNPSFVPANARDKFAKHGLHVSAVGILVTDAAYAHARAVAGGAASLSPPTKDEETGVVTAEVCLYPGGDAALRFVSGEHLDTIPFLPGYQKSMAYGIDAPGGGTYGIERIDHVVGNVPDLLAAVDYITAACGFHEFAEFTAEDVGTVDSGLNSMVLASNTEAVLLPVNEPTGGGKRKSQILTYLEQHGGPGVQHIALKTNDIFATVAAMRAAHRACGGFELMERPREQYYDKLRERLGEGVIDDETARQCRELGILADADDQGVLLQIFTKPIGDRSTLFLEIIQRVGCTKDPVTKARIDQTPGCGGFGKGNFHELFRAIEEYETRAGINKIG